jgi:molecular chaperone Hsp33
MLRSLGRDEAAAAAAANGGDVRVRCEFCGETYDFDPGEIETLFATPRQTVEGPTALQ